MGKLFNYDHVELVNKENNEEEIKMSMERKAKENNDTFSYLSNFDDFCKFMEDPDTDIII